MQSANDLLIKLHKQNVKVWSKGGRLCFQASDTALLDEDLAKLRRLEPELVGLLQRMDFSRHVRIAPRPVGCSVPLSPLQLVYLNYLLEECAGLASRVSSFAVRIAGPLDVSALRRSIDGVVWRHESLRTQLVLNDGQPCQRVADTCDYDWELVDLSNLSPTVAATELRRHAEDIFSARLNILEGRYFAVKLFRLSAQEHVLVLALDHMITDGASNRILIDEAWRLYARAKGEAAHPLPEPSVQYPDYAVWLQQAYGSWLQTHQGYWRERLQNSPSVQLPMRDDSADAATAAMEISLGSSLSERLRELSRKERVCLSVTVLALYLLVMSRWCNVTDLVAGFSTNGRHRADLQGTVGFISHTLYLRVEILGNERFAELLKRVNLEFRRALSHPTFGWVSNAEAHTELAFNWLPRHGAEAAANAPRKDQDGTLMTPFPLPLVGPWKFGPLFYENDNGVGVHLTYRTDLLEYANRFGNNLRSLAQRIVCDPLCCLKSLPTE